MIPPGDPSLEERVLALPATAGDAAVTQVVLAEAGIRCTICSDIDALCRDFQDGAGVVLLTEETLGAGADRLVETVQQQPAWSDVPIVLLTDRGADSPAALWAMDRLGNVTVLERPVRMITLISTLRTALKARRRQVELRRQTEALRDSEENFRSMFAVSSVGIAQADIAARRFIRVNAAFCAMTGYTEAELLALNVDELNHPDDRATDSALFGRLVRGETPDYRSEKRYVRKDGRVIWVLASGNVVRDAEGRPLHAWAVVQDITARKEAENGLREADRRKDEFLATLAHELRNPLAPIRNAVEILKRVGPADPILVRNHSVIDRQVRHMARLLDDLLDVSRITRNRLELRRERVELADVVRVAIETSRPLIDRNAHDLSVTLPPGRIPLDADPVRLAQVFSNLLNNAARYTEPGGRIWLSAARHGGEVVVSVRDNGVGIDADMLPRVFDLFSQAAPALQRSQGGLGIGLSLVKGLVEMHGGRIAAHSDGPGQGSEFTVRLPIAVVETADRDAAAQDGAPAAGVRRILVVDDIEDNADTMATLLRELGNDVRTAYGGAEAVEAAADFRPSVVLLDIGMPRVTGLDAARMIRAQPWGAKICLIALTGWAGPEDRRRTQDAGFDHHLVKPVDYTQLLRLLA